MRDHIPATISEYEALRKSAKILAGSIRQFARIPEVQAQHIANDDADMERMLLGTKGTRWQRILLDRESLLGALSALDASPGVIEADVIAAIAGAHSGSAVEQARAAMARVWGEK